VSKKNLIDLIKRFFVEWIETDASPPLPMMHELNESRSVRVPILFCFSRIHNVQILTFTAASLSVRSAPIPAEAMSRLSGKNSSL
jgi:hypothetical protein